MKLETLISEEQLQTRIKALGEEIKNDYAGRDVVIICVLTGSVFFMADLAKHLDPAHTLFDFMQVSSYHGGTESKGSITLTKDLTSDITGKDVIVVEDIIDTGLTIEYTISYLKDRGANSVKLCTLLHKNKVEMNVDYVGFNIPNKFVVGYGLDYEEKYRNLTYVGIKTE